MSSSDLNKRFIIVLFGRAWAGVGSGYVSSSNQSNGSVHCVFCIHSRVSKYAVASIAAVALNRVIRSASLRSVESKHKNLVCFPLDRNRTLQVHAHFPADPSWPLPEVVVGLYQEDKSQSSGNCKNAVMAFAEYLLGAGYRCVTPFISSWTLT